MTSIGTILGNPAIGLSFSPSRMIVLNCCRKRQRRAGPSVPRRRGMGLSDLASPMGALFGAGFFSNPIKKKKQKKKPGGPPPPPPLVGPRLGAFNVWVTLPLLTQHGRETSIYRLQRDARSISGAWFPAAFLIPRGGQSVPRSARPDYNCRTPHTQIWDIRRMGPFLPVSSMRGNCHGQDRRDIEEKRPRVLCRRTRKRTTAWPPASDRGLPACRNSRQRGPLRKSPLLTPKLSTRRTRSAAAGSGQRVGPKDSMRVMRLLAKCLCLISSCLQGIDYDLDGTDLVLSQMAWRKRSLYPHRFLRCPPMPTPTGMDMVW